jgi:hypothetical protein
MMSFLENLSTRLVAETFTEVLPLLRMLGRAARRVDACGAIVDAILTTRCAKQM